MSILPEQQPEVMAERSGLQNALARIRREAERQEANQALWARNRDFHAVFVGASQAYRQAEAWLQEELAKLSTVSR